VISAPFFRDLGTVVLEPPAAETTKDLFLTITDALYWWLSFPLFSCLLFLYLSLSIQTFSIATALQGQRLKWPEEYSPLAPISGIPRIGSKHHG